MDEGNVMQAKDVGPTSPGKVYQYLASLIGTDNAWRSAAEIAKHLESDTLDGRNAVAKALWTLNNNGRISRRMRPGTGFKECMALVDDASVRQAAQRPAPNRVAIAPPVAGPVALRVEAAPAPVLPEPSPEDLEAVEKLVRSPTPALTLADLVTKQRARMEQIQADAVVATALDSPTAVETGPLEDSSGPIASEAPALDIKAECAAIAERCDGDDDASDDQAQDNESPELADELRAFGQLIERGKRDAPAILYRDTKLTVLRDLAELAPPLTAYYLREIAADLERAGAGA